MKTENIVIRVTPELKQEIKLAAKCQSKTVTEWILDIVKYELRNLDIYGQFGFMNRKKVDIDEVRNMEIGSRF